jgi:hypothetical protein
VKLPFFTIGHSTRPIEAFVELLRAGQVAMVIDIRTVPRSRTNPQYNLDALPATLAEYQIGHGRIDALGGLRGKSRDLPPEVNGCGRTRASTIMPTTPCRRRSGTAWKSWSRSAANGGWR